MKSQRLFLAFAFGVGLVWLLVFALKGHTALAQADVCDRYVVVGGNDSWPDNNCSNPNTPCKSVQYALMWASPGERICVADRDDIDGPSTYYGPIVITRSVTLDGAWAAHPNPLGAGWVFTPTLCTPQDVVLSGNGTVRVISITNASPAIYCFTITGGNAGGAADDPNRGGGIAARDAAPIIVGNIITGNYGCSGAVGTGQGRGGGVYLVNAPATAVISNNLIANNTAAEGAAGWGGGIYLENSSPQVLSNTIQANHAGQMAGNGGGIAVIGGSPLIADNLVLANIAGQGGMAHGGGIFIDSDTVVTVERNLIEGNKALTGTASAGLYSRGGGLFYDGPLAVIRDNQVYGNVATLMDSRGLGGGMYLRGLSTTAEVRGNVANDNRASYVGDGAGGGIYLDECYATVADNRVADNAASSSPPAQGGGFYINGGGGLIQGNVITHNQAVIWAVGKWAYGGGMAISGSIVLVQDNLIAHNQAAEGTNARGVGGGVCVWGGAPRFVGNEVLSNITTGGDGDDMRGFGGGFDLVGSSPWLEGNTILDNRAVGSAEGGGGGVRVGSCHEFTLTNNIIARNAVSTTGSGVAVVNSGVLGGHVAHNTIVANLSGDGVGVYVGTNSEVWLYNNVIVSQTVGITNATPGTSVVSATHTLFEDNGTNYGTGVTSINQVPGPAGLLPDYHLGSGSNAIGNATPLAWVTTDIDGDPRPLPAGTAPDIGADEIHQRRVYLPLVLRNF